MIATTASTTAVVRRPDRTLSWKRVALQAHQAGLTYAQQARIGAAVRRMATGATLSLYREVLKYERSLFIGVTLGAYGITAGDAPHVSQSARTVEVVAIRALDEALVHAVVEGLGKICLGGGVAPVA